MIRSISRLKLNDEIDDVRGKKECSDDEVYDETID